MRIKHIIAALPRAAGKTLPSLRDLEHRLRAKHSAKSAKQTTTVLPDAL
jgi:hypothetical protein